MQTKKSPFFKPKFRHQLGRCDMLVLAMALEMTMLKEDIVTKYILEYKYDQVNIH